MPHVSGRMPALVAAVTAVLATASPLCAQPACRLDGPIPLAGDAHPECSPLSPPGRANLEITQTLPRQVECNADIPVEVVVANTGDAAAENVIVKDVLSADYQLLDAFPTPERLRGTLTWRLGRLERGDQRRLRLRLQLRDTTRVEFIHLVTATFETPVQSRGAAPVLHPGLALDVTGPDAVNVSEPFTLTVTIRNTGNGPARDMALQAALPAGLIHPAGADLENAIGTLDAGRTHTVALALIPTRTGDIGGRIRVVAKGVAAVEQAYRLHVRDVRLHLIAKEQAYGSPDGSYTFLWTVVNQGTEAALRARRREPRWTARSCRGVRRLPTRTRRVRFRAVRPGHHAGRQRLALACPHLGRRTSGRLGRRRGRRVWPRIAHADARGAAAVARCPANAASHEWSAAGAAAGRHAGPDRGRGRARRGHPQRADAIARGCRRPGRAAGTSGADTRGLGPAAHLRN